MKRAILLNDTSLAGNHGSHLVVSQLIKLADKHNIRVLERYSINSNLNMIKGNNFDLVLVNGEGSLHHSNKAAKSISLVPDWARNYKLNAFLINTIYQQNSSEIFEGVKNYKKIYVRDILSFEELKKLGANPSAVADLSLTWETKSNLANNRSTIIVTDSSNRSTNIELFELSQRLHNSTFVPFKSRPPSISGANWNNFSRQAKYTLRKIASISRTSELDRIRYKNIIPEFDQFINFLCSRAQTIITGRYHAVCLAIVLEIPFIAVPSNSFKIETLLRQIGMQHRLVQSPLNQIVENELTSTFSRYSEDELETISNFKNGHKHQANLMFETISQQS